MILTAPRWRAARPVTRPHPPATEPPAFFPAPCCNWLAAPLEVGFQLPPPWPMAADTTRRWTVVRAWSLGRSICDTEKPIPHLLDLQLQAIAARMFYLPTILISPIQAQRGMPFFLATPVRRTLSGWLRLTPEFLRIIHPPVQPPGRRSLSGAALLHLQLKPPTMTTTASK